MADTVIIPLSVQFKDAVQNFRSLVETYQKELDKLTPGTSIYKSIESQLKQAMALVKRTDLQANIGVSKESQITKMTSDLESVQYILGNVKEAFSNLGFKDLNLGHGSFEQFRNDVRTIENEINSLNLKKQELENLSVAGALNKAGLDKKGFNKGDLDKGVIQYYNEVTAAIQKAEQAIVQLQEQQKLLNTSITANQGTMDQTKNAHFLNNLYNSFGMSKSTVDSISSTYSNMLTEQYNAGTLGSVHVQNALKMIGLDDATISMLQSSGANAAQKFQEVLAELSQKKGPDQFNQTNARKNISDYLKNNYGGAQGMKNDAKAYDAASKQLNTNNAKLAEISSKIKTQENAVKRYTVRRDKISGVTKEYSDLQNNLNTLSQRVTTLEQQVANSVGKGLGTGNVPPGDQQASAGIAKNTAQEQMGAAIDNMARRWIGTYAIVNKVRRAIRQAWNDIKSLDKAMTNIAVVTNMSVDQLWGQIDQYMSIAQQYGVTTQGVYEVSQIFYQQGLDTSDVVAATTETLKMARIAGMEYKEAADAMTVAIRAFKMEMTDAAHVTDVYSKVASITASDSNELATAMSKTASSAENVGSSFENTTAMLAVMIETTRESAQNLGSALKSIISRYGEMKAGLTKDSEGEEIDYNKVDTALKSVGISIKDAQGQFRDFDDVIFELSEKWDTLDKNTQRYIATIMAGNRQQSRFIALVDNWERLDEVSDVANNEADDAGLLQYSKTLDSLDAKINNLKTSFQELYMSIANGPAFKGILDFINNVLQGFTKFKTGLITFLPSLIISIRGVFQAIKFLSTKFFSGLYANAVNSFTQISNYKIIIHKSAEETMSEISRAEEAERLANSVSSSQMSGQAKVSFWKNPKGKVFGAGSAAAGVGGMALTMAGTGLSMWGASKAGEGGSENVVSGAWLSGGGTAASLAGMGLMVGGPVGLLIGSIVGIGAGLVQALNVVTDKIALMEEDVKQAEKEQEEAELKKAEAQQEYNSLDGYIEKLENSQNTRYNSVEAEQEWIELNNKIFETFPELEVSFDNAGNAIIDLAEAEDLLSKKRQEAASAASEAADSAVKTEKAKLALEMEKINQYQAMLNSANPTSSRHNVRAYNTDAFPVPKIDKAWAEVLNPGPDDWYTIKNGNEKTKLDKGQSVLGTVNPKALYQDPEKDNRVTIQSNMFSGKLQEGMVYNPIPPTNNYRDIKNHYKSITDYPSVFLYQSGAVDSEGNLIYDVLSKSLAVRDMLPYLVFNQDTINAGIFDWLNALGNSKTAEEFVSAFIDGYTDLYTGSEIPPLELLKTATEMGFRNDNFNTYEEIIQMNNLLKRKKAEVLDQAYNTSVKTGINARTQSLLSYYEEDSLKEIPNVANIINGIAYREFTAEGQKENYETYFDVNSGAGQFIIEDNIAKWQSFYENSPFTTIKELSALMENSTHYTPDRFETEIKNLVKDTDLQKQIMDYYNEQYTKAYDRFKKSLASFKIKGELEDYKIPQEFFDEVSSFGEHLQNLIKTEKLTVEDGNRILQHYLYIYKAIGDSDLFKDGKNQNELFEIQSLLANADYTSPEGIFELLNSLKVVYESLGQALPPDIERAVNEMLQNSLINLHTSYISFGEKLASNIDSLAEDLEKAGKGFKDFKDVVEFANKYDLSLNDFNFDTLTGQWLSTSEVYQAIYDKQKKDYEDLKTRITNEAEKQRTTLATWAGEDTKKNKYINGTDWTKKSYEDLKYDLGFYNKDTGEINENLINVNNIFASNWDRYVDWYEKADETQRKSFYNWMLLEQQDTLDALDSASKEYLDYLANDSNRTAALNSGTSKFDIKKYNYFGNIKNQAFKSLSSKHSGLSAEEIEGYGYDIFGDINAFYSYATQNLDGTWDLNLSKLKKSPLWKDIPTEIKNTILSTIDQEFLSAKEALNNLATKLGSGEAATLKISDYQAILGNSASTFQREWINALLTGVFSKQQSASLMEYASLNQTTESAAIAAMEEIAINWIAEASNRDVDEVRKEWNAAKGTYEDSVEETQSKLYDLYLKRIDGTITNAEEKLIAEYEAVEGVNEIENLNIANKVEGYLQMVNAFLTEGTEEAIDNAIEAYKKVFKEKRKNAGKDKTDISNTIKESDGFYKEEDVAEFLGKYGIRLTEQELNEIFNYDELTGDLVLASAEQADRFYSILEDRGGEKAEEAFKVSEAEKILNKAIEKSETQDSIQSTLEGFYGDLSSVTLSQLTELYKQVTGKDSVDSDTLQQYQDAINAAEKGQTGLLIERLKDIQSLATEYDIDTSALDAAYQDAITNLINSLASSLTAAVEGTLSATEYETLRKQYNLKDAAMRTASGYQLSANDQRRMMLGMVGEAQKTGSTLGLGKVFQDSFSETDGLLASYEDIVKEIADVEKALSDGWTETEAAIYGAKEVAEGYLQTLKEIQSQSHFDTENPLFNIDNQNGFLNAADTYDTFTSSISKVRDILATISDGGQLSYREFGDFIDFITQTDPNAWKAFSDGLNLGATSSEDLIQKMNQLADFDGILDFGKITADMGINIGASMEDMADTTAKSLAEVARSQVDYLTGLETMLKAMLAIQNIGEIELGITTTLNGEKESRLWSPAELIKLYNDSEADSPIREQIIGIINDSLGGDWGKDIKDAMAPLAKAMGIEVDTLFKQILGGDTKLDPADWDVFSSFYGLLELVKKDYLSNEQLQSVFGSLGEGMFEDGKLVENWHENFAKALEAIGFDELIAQYYEDIQKTAEKQAADTKVPPPATGGENGLLNNGVTIEVPSQAAETFLTGAQQFLASYGFTSTDNKNYVYNLEGISLKVVLGTTSTISFDIASAQGMSTVQEQLKSAVQVALGLGGENTTITVTDPATGVSYVISGKITPDMASITPPAILSSAELTTIMGKNTTWDSPDGGKTWTSSVGWATFSYSASTDSFTISPAAGTILNEKDIETWLQEKCGAPQTDGSYKIGNYTFVYSGEAKDFTVTGGTGTVEDPVIAGYTESTENPGTYTQTTPFAVNHQGEANDLAVKGGTVTVGDPTITDGKNGTYTEQSPYNFLATALIEINANADAGTTEAGNPNITVGDTTIEDGYTLDNETNKATSTDEIEVTQQADAKETSAGSPNITVGDTTIESDYTLDSKNNKATSVDEIEVKQQASAGETNAGSPNITVDDSTINKDYDLDSKTNTATSPNEIEVKQQAKAGETAAGSPNITVGDSTIDKDYDLDSKNNTATSPNKIEVKQQAGAGTTSAGSPNVTVGETTIEGDYSLDDKTNTATSSNKIEVTQQAEAKETNAGSPNVTVDKPTIPSDDYDLDTTGTTATSKKTITFNQQATSNPVNVNSPTFNLPAPADFLKSLGSDWTCDEKTGIYTKTTSMGTFTYDGKSTITVTPSSDPPEGLTIDGLLTAIYGEDGWKSGKDGYEILNPDGSVSFTIKPNVKPNWDGSGLTPTEKGDFTGNAEIKVKGVDGGIEEYINSFNDKVVNLNIGFNLGGQSNPQYQAYFGELAKEAQKAILNSTRDKKNQLPIYTGNIQGALNKIVPLMMTEHSAGILSDYDAKMFYNLVSILADYGYLPNEYNDQKTFNFSQLPWLAGTFLNPESSAKQDQLEQTADSLAPLKEVFSDSAWVTQIVNLAGSLGSLSNVDLSDLPTQFGYLNNLELDIDNLGLINNVLKAISDVASDINTLNGSQITVNIEPAKTKLDELLEYYKKIIFEPKTIDITENRTIKYTGGIGEQEWTGTMNNISGSALADGSIGRLRKGASLAQKTLVGELGPELAVYDGQYHMLGANGAEFVKLPNDAIVFNHLQTEGILNGQMNIRGKAMADGNVQGPALAGGSNIEAALAAVGRAKTLWEGLLNKLTAAELLDGGGGGGGGDNSIKAHTDELQEWYNLSRKIAYVEQEINNLLAERANIQEANGEAYLRNLREQEALLREQVATQDTLLRYQQMQLDRQAEHINNNEIWSQFLEVDENGLLQYRDGNELFGKGALSVLDELNKMSGQKQYDFITKKLGYSYTDQDGKELKNEELIAKFYEELQKQIDEYDALYDTVHETESTLEELQSTINEINEEIKENQMDLEQAIYDIIVEAWEKEIEEMEKQAEVIKEANDAYIQGLNDALTKEKELYEQDQRISDREQLQRQLSLLRRSGGSASEIANLEEQLDGMLKDEYFNNQQKMIEKIQDANEEQVRKLDEQITIQQESLEYQKETGALWTQVYQVLSQDSAAILAFMAGQSSDFFTKSGLTQQQALEEWSKKVGIYTEDRQRQNYQKKAEQNWSSGSIWQDSALSGYQDVYNNLDSEAQTNLQNLYNSTYTQSMLEGMNSDQAHQTAAAKLQEQLEYWKSQQDASNRPNEEETNGNNQTTDNHEYTFLDVRVGEAPKAAGCSVRAGLTSLWVGYGTNLTYTAADGWIFNGYQVSNDKVRINGNRVTAVKAGRVTITAMFRRNSRATENSSNSDSGKWGFTLTKDGKQVYSSGGKWISQVDAADAADELIAGTYPGSTYTLKKYAEGGLVDYTGPAIVHGTPSKPEAFLNAKQTAMISEAVKAAGDGGALDGIKSTLAALNSSIKSIVNTNLSESSNFTVAPGAVTINVAKISDTYDIEELSNDVMNRMVSIASKSTNRGVNRR